MRIGNEYFNIDLFKGWSKDKFKKFFDSHGYEKSTGKTSDEVYSLLDIGVKMKGENKKPIE